MSEPHPSAMSSALLVARWSFLELLWSPRTLAMLGIAGAPLALALLHRLARALEMTEGGPGFSTFAAIVAGASFPFVAPMLTLFYASGVVSDDVEAGTMRYFLTRPVRRGALLGGKMLASLALAGLLFLPSLVAAYYLTLAPEGFRAIGAGFPSLLIVLSVAVLGLVAYNGVFALAGTALRRPLLASLFFVFGWQAVATFVPGRARLATVAHYLRSLIPRHLLEGDFAALAGERSSALGAFLALVAIAVVTHALAIWIFARKEVP